jgi:hypothetical protein
MDELSSGPERAEAPKKKRRRISNEAKVASRSTKQKAPVSKAANKKRVVSGGANSNEVNGGEKMTLLWLL